MTYDTIAAIATGGFPTAIGIVRVSGANAISAADSIFQSANGIKLCDAENRRMYYGQLFGTDGNLLDFCVATISRGPKSFTGEDTAEFHCHGSAAVLSEVLRALFAYGVRQARQGEFTKRAFLNGRIDITQAEAVIDVIESETVWAAQNAAAQLGGAISLRIEPVYNSLLDIMAHFHALIDYPDEDIDEFEMQNYLSVLRKTEKLLTSMLETHERGRVLRDGIPTVILGRPNTGKSSLLNALLGYERAIVTDIPGTTRDTIEEKLVIGGVLLRVIDTAGLRETKDTVEKLGVERTKAAISKAKMALLVFDGSESPQSEDIDILCSIPSDVPIIAVINKSDMPPNSQFSTFNSQLELCGGSTVSISALTGEGLDSLEKEISKTLGQATAPPTGEFITNIRQADAIKRARDSIIKAIDAAAAQMTADAVLVDIEETLAAIGEVTGKTMKEDVIDRIFERFCVGK